MATISTLPPDTITRFIDAARTWSSGSVSARDARRIGSSGMSKSLGILALVLAALAFPVGTTAQTLVPIPALSFSTTYGQADPLAQLLTVNSTGASFNFTAAATTTTGGTWLTISPSSYGYGLATPRAVTVIAKPAVTLAAGTYTGQIVVTPVTKTIPIMTIPVTLIVHATTETYFDQVAGGLTYTMETGGSAPPGAGSANPERRSRQPCLDCHDEHGRWRRVAQPLQRHGTAPSNLTVNIVKAHLPGTGLTAGTFTGQVLLKSAGDTLTVPITVIVGPSVFPQIDPLNFVKTYAGANPLSQVITMASTGTDFTFTASVQNATGGNWLTISPSSYGYGLSTPQAITVGVNPTVTLAAGTYMAEVMVNSVDGAQALSIPVTLTINPTTAAYFDNVAGALDFSMETTGEAPPKQELQIRNAGTGTLAWTASTTTADGGAWLTVSPATGTAPSNLYVTVNKQNLPGSGLMDGTFIGQVVLQSDTSRVTIPVTYVVNENAFRQVNPLNFTKAYGGANPLPQVIPVASTGTNFTFTAVTANATGGSWLQISPSAYGYGLSTPQTVTVSVNPSITLAAGTYSAEIIAKSVTGAQALVIPVTLTIQEATASFFDALPGQISFSMLVKGNPPPAQMLPIRNAGIGTLDWTATTSTSDGGAWLNISATADVAPANPTVTVNPVNLPGGGLVAGTFTGQVILQANGSQVTIPVSMVVGASVFRQISPLTFTIAYGGANPLPQVITVASTGTDFTCLATTANSTGGTWLNISPSAYGYGLSTPRAITVSATPAATLAAGTYSSQINIRSADGTQDLSVPVTLIIEPKAAAFFDSLPGQLSYSMLTGGAAPPAQPLEIRNAGTGTLSWTSTLSTSDGGAWLAISPATGTAPTAPQVTVTPAKLPGGGLTAGTFTGQVVLVSGADRVTIPVTMVVGANVFRQVNALDFNMTYGGAAPLPQLVNITSTGAAFTFLARAVNSTGGGWLTITPSAYGYGLSTPRQMTVTITPAATLAVGTYMAEIIVQAAAGSPSMVIPVTLTVNPATATHFDDMSGGVSFFQATGGPNPAAQAVPIRNAGVGTLDWTAPAITSDGAAWLTLSAVSGTAPSNLTVSIKSTNLPGKGLVAGIYTGQVLLKTGTGRQTIPIQVVVGASVFQPVAALSFSKPYNGANPAAQTLNVASTATNFTFLGFLATATGGAWLNITPGSYGYGISTPEVIQVSVSPVTTLAVGSYVGEIILTSVAGDQGMVIPVTITIQGGTATATPTFTPPGGT